MTAPEQTLRDELRKAAAMDEARPDWTKRRMPTIAPSVPPEPSRPADEHTDAVARAVDPDIFDPTVKRSTHPAAVIQIAARKHMASEAARNVLTSTDPAVHAAMLAALVRAGVLTAGQAKFGALPIRPGDSFSGRAG